MAGLGIGRTFQNVALFGSMSVRDNMLVGAHHLGRSGFIANALRLPHPARERGRPSGRLDELLDLLDLREVADTPAAACRSARSKRVELARALIGQPKLLLLDEPAAGLNHSRGGRPRRAAATIRAISNSASCWSSIT